MIEVQGKFYFVDVVDILEDLGITKYKYQDSNIMCCCPIHGERNPSFGIHKDTGLYQCFSCGARGTILDLICELRGITAEDAKKYLRKFHLDNRSVPDISINKIYKPKLELFDIKDSRIALDYLKSRGIGEYVVSQFSVSDKEGCIVFPIKNIRGKFVGYQKRFIDKKQFIFSTGFDKNKNVYGIDILREQGNPDKAVFITESIIDCLTLWQYGYQAVSVFSAHMTKDHTKLLSQTPFRYIVDGLDRDLAGRLGWERAESMLRSKGFKPISLGEHGKKDINELTYEEFQSWVIGLRGII